MKVKENAKDLTELYQMHKDLQMLHDLIKGSNGIAIKKGNHIEVFEEKRLKEVKRALIKALDYFDKHGDPFVN